MKIRCGFVSNSSSSSFVMLGAPLKTFKPSQEEMKKLLDKYSLKYDKDDEYDVEDQFWDAMYNGNFDGLKYIGEPSMVGYMIARDSDYCMDETETNVEDLNEMKVKVEKTVKEVFGEEIEAKLFTGTYAC